jgi:uncharacterized repeat protein (TIGR01451 family)
MATRTSRLLLAAVSCVALAFLLVTTTRAGGGNSANAMLCQKNGWQSLFRTDGTVFGNQGDCVSYGARGGKLNGPPVLTITKTADAAIVKAGSRLGVTVTLSNTGGGKATGVKLTDELPHLHAGDHWEIDGGNTKAFYITDDGKSLVNSDTSSTVQTETLEVHIGMVDFSEGDCPRTYYNTATVTADNAKPATAAASIDVQCP